MYVLLVVIAFSTILPRKGCVKFSIVDPAWVSLHAQVQVGVLAVISQSSLEHAQRPVVKPQVRRSLLACFWIGKYYYLLSPILFKIHFGIQKRIRSFYFVLPISSSNLFQKFNTILTLRRPIRFKLMRCGVSLNLKFIVLSKPYFFQCILLLLDKSLLLLNICMYVLW